jgi:negative regulator of flagellin synthesis FlgM
MKSVAQKPARPDSASSDRVQLSALAAGLQQAGAAIDDTPVADAARVAEIKQAISESRFQIRPERIADGLLQSVRDMLANRG